MSDQLFAIWAGADEARTGEHAVSGDLDDNLAFLDDAPLAERAAEREERERGFLTDDEVKVTETRQERISRESRELDEEITRDERKRERTDYEARGEKVPERLKELPDPAVAFPVGKGSDEMADLEFAAHIANLKAGGVEALRDDDRSASQMLAQQARDAEAQINSLQDNLPDTYDGYSQEDLREAMDHDEDLQKYVTARHGIRTSIMR